MNKKLEENKRRKGYKEGIPEKEEQKDMESGRKEGMESN